MISRIFVLLLLFSASIFAQSPISKGSINLNGNLYFSSRSYDNSAPTQSILSLNPQFGYFLVNNLSLSLSIDYERISSEESNTSFGLGPNIRYYFNIKNLFPFISLGYSFTKANNSGIDYEFSGNQVILGAGITYMITESVALETTLSYRFDKQKYSYELSEINYKSESEIDSEIFMIGIGINYFLYEKQYNQPLKPTAVVGEQN